MPAALTLREATGLFLDTLLQDRNTHRTYATGLSAFEAFMSDAQGPVENEAGPVAPVAASVPLSSLHDNAIEDFHLYLVDRGYSRFTQRTYQAALSAFLNYSLVHDLLPGEFSLAKAKEKLRRSNRRFPYPAPVPDPALPLIIKYYDDLDLPGGDDRQTHLAGLRILRSRAIVHTLYSSAGRIAEVASLSRRDVADGRQMQVVITGKGNKQRFIYLTDLARAAIGTYVRARADAHAPLFISHGRDYGKRLSKVSIWETVKQAGRALRLEVTPHDFRHYRARQMLDEGAPLEAIQEILGHSDISTTRKVYAIYSHRSIRDIFAGATLTPEALQRTLERPSH
jgi:integrase/recombinase XerD